jgi:drug/metabolite transporter (DMT)-like permease
VTATATRARGLGAVVVAIVLLSLGSTLVKWSGATGSVVAFWRLVIGVGVWLAVLRAAHVRLTARDLRLAVPPGLLFGFNISLFFTSVKLTRVANVEFLGTLSPVLVVPAAALLLGERVRWRLLGFGAVALVGVAIVLLGAPTVAGDDGLAGDLLAAGAVATWAVYLLLTKRVRRTMDTKVFMAGMTIGAVFGAAPVAVGSGDLFGLDARGWFVVVVLALSAGVVAHGLLAWAQRHVAVSTMSLMQLAQPGLAALWAFLVLGEEVAPVQFVGMALVVAGVGAVALETARRTAPPVPLAGTVAVRTSAAGG